MSNMKQSPCSMAKVFDIACLPVLPTTKHLGHNFLYFATLSVLKRLRLKRDLIEGDFDRNWQAYEKYFMAPFNFDIEAKQLNNNIKERNVAHENYWKAQNVHSKSYYFQEILSE